MNVRVNGWALSSTYPSIVRYWEYPPLFALINSSTGDVLMTIKPYVITPTAVPCKINAPGRNIVNVYKKGILCKDVNVVNQAQPAGKRYIWHLGVEIGSGI